MLCTVFCSLQQVCASAGSSNLKAIPGSFPPGRSPCFIENKGQIRDLDGTIRHDIDFKVDAGGLQIFVGKGKIHYQWHRFRGREAAVAAGQEVKPAGHEFYRMDMALEGSAAQPVQCSRERRKEGFNLYYNNDGSVSRASFYEKITYKNIYPQIDWVIYVQEGALKYDFVVHPGGSVSDIKLNFSGHNSLNLEQGALVARTPYGTVRENIPYSIEQESGAAVNVSFALSEDYSIGFKAEAYSGTLVIDPVLTFDWGTYYGGSSYEMSAYLGNSLAGYYGAGNSLFTDYEGNILLAGTTLSIDNIATTGSFKQEKKEVEGANVYLVKFNSSGERLWASYYGGYLGSNGYDQFPDENKLFYYGTRAGRGHSIAADSLGNIYMTGTTWNDSGIATTGAHQEQRSGRSWPDLFVVKFNKDGQRLWGTYLGNSRKEEGGSIVVSADGRKIYVAGGTEAILPNTQPDYIITKNAFLPFLGGTPDHIGFLAQFNQDGRQEWGTFIGNTKYGWSTVYDMALDTKGAVYLTGYTNDAKGALMPTDTCMATFDGHQIIIGGCPAFGPCLMDAFVQKWDSTGKRIWGTYYGGDLHDFGYGIACDDSANVYVTGVTQSSFNIGSTGSHQELLQGTTNAFLAKFNAEGKRQWGTYFGKGNEAGYTVLCANKKVYMMGKAASDSLATPDAYQQYSGENWSWNAGLLVQFCPSGLLEYATYFGGDNMDFNYSLANNGIIAATAGRERDSIYSCPIYLTGITNVAESIVSEGAYQDTLNGLWDTYLVKFATNTDSYIERQFCKGSTFTFDGKEYAQAGLFTHFFSRSGQCDSIVTLNLGGVDLPEPSVTVDEQFTLSTTLPYASYQWLQDGTVIEGATEATYRVKTNGQYAVIVQNELGCQDTSDVYTITNVGVVLGDKPEEKPFVYPNPARDVIYIYSKHPLRAVWSTIEGRIIREENNVEKTSIGGWVPGIYILQLFYQDGALALRKKIVVR